MLVRNFEIRFVIVVIKYAKAVLEVKLDTILQYTWLQLYQLNYVLGKNESMFC